jgi:hypothetical protein
LNSRVSVAPAGFGQVLPPLILEFFGSANSTIGLAFRHSPMRNCASEDAPFGAGPESILPVVVMDSGLARFARAPE